MWLPIPWPTKSRTTENPSASTTFCTACADIAQRRSRLYHRDARMQRLLCHFEQPRRVGSDLFAHWHRDGSVAEIAVHNRTAIHRNDVPFFQDPLLRWNAVHHLIVDRCAEHARKPVIALEGRLRTEFS